MKRPEDGVPVTSRIVDRGENMVALADGRVVSATRYSLVGKVALDDWHDSASVWTALRTEVRGADIDYRRTT